MNRLSVMRAVIFVVGVLVIGAQAALPCMCIWAGGGFIPHELDGGTFLQQRLRFQWLFHPHSIERTPYEVLSVAQRKDHFVALLTLNTTAERPGPVIEVDFDLRTGGASTHNVSSSRRYLVSDGKGVLGALTSDELICPPVVWAGRVISIGDPPSEDLSPKVLEYNNGSWRDTDQFLPVPNEYYYRIAVGTDGCNRGPLCFALINNEMVFYCRNPALLTSTEAESFVIEYENDPIACRGRFGIVAVPKAIVPLLPERYDGGDAFWFQNGRLCTLELVSTDRIHNGKLRFVQYGASAGNEVVQLADSPVRWFTNPYNVPVRITDVGLMAPTDMTGNCKALFLFWDEFGRLAVLEWRDNRLSVIASRSSPYVSRVLIDGFMLILVGWAVPMGILVGAASWAIRIRPGSEKRNPKFAPVLKRGIARAIDVGAVMFPVLAGMACEWDFMAWWQYAMCELQALTSSFHNDEILAVAMHFDIAVRTFASMPVPWLWVAMGLVTVILQAYLQGRWGITAGKWLLGLRVMGMSSKPCGFARSLLRELFIMLDGLMILSFVPGVVCIVASQQSQRIGDLLSGTVVIDSRSPMDLSKEI